jgi:hypothetical protein
MRFMDIRKRVYEIPELGRKAPLVCIPTTSGTGGQLGGVPAKLPCCCRCCGCCHLPASLAAAPP